MKKTKILLLTTSIDDGGAEKYLMIQFGHLPMEQLEVDYFVIFETKSNSAVEYYNNLGIHIHLQHIVPSSLLWYVEYYKRLKSFFAQNEHFDALHVNGCAIQIQLLACIAAKKAMVPVRIVHSHNAPIKKANFLKSFITKLLQVGVSKEATNFVACSTVAGKAKFGDKVIASERFAVMKNGIDTDLYRFNPEIRNRIREKNGLQDAIVIGHIGRFEEQKNHDYLIDIFNQAYLKDNRCRLILIGKGELEPQIMQKVSELKLEKAIFFIGFISNVSEYLQVMDVFCLPSLYEGLVIVGVEAQAAGLPGVYSSAISSELKLTDLVQFLPLSASPLEWADCLLREAGRSRRDTSGEVKAAGYDVKTSAFKLMEIYQNKK